MPQTRRLKEAIEGARSLSRTELVAVDAVVACVFAVSYLAAGVPGWPLVLVVALRRFWPLPVFAAVTFASIAALAAGALPDPFLAAAFTAYAAAALGEGGRRGWAAVGASSVVLLFLAMTTGTSGPWPDRLRPLLPGVALVGACWAAGVAVAQRRAYAASRAADRLARALADERLRIAREVHDIVSHNLGVIAVRAAVTRHVAGDATAALEAIERVSKAALAEMRQALRVLRDSDGPRGPSPGLGEVPALVRAVRETGVAVECVLPDGGALPAGVGLTAYRIIQEALSNVVRHAGATRCRVVARCAGDEVVIEVADDGPVRKAPGEGGFGLAGMRERVGVHGGELTAGPVAEGGFRVLARIPVR